MAERRHMHGLGVQAKLWLHAMRVCVASVVKGKVLPSSWQIVGSGTMNVGSLVHIFACHRIANMHLASIGQLTRPLCWVLRTVQTESHQCTILLTELPLQMLWV